MFFGLRIFFVTAGWTYRSRSSLRNNFTRRWKFPRFASSTGMTADDLEEAKEWEQRLSCIFFEFFDEKNVF